MKKILLLCCLFVFAANVFGCTLDYVEFAEITFYQDSVNPMTIHLICKIRGLVCTSAPVYWGDGTQGDVSLVDTFSAPVCISGAPVAVYEGSHTYSSAWADSIVLIGLEIDETNTFIQLGGGSPLSPIAAVNFAYLQNQNGFHSPTFNGAYFVTDTIQRILYYDPMIEYDTSHTMRAALIKPIVYYPDNTYGMFLPSQYNPGPNNIISVDSITGLLTWNAPPKWINYLISIQASEYQNGVFVCSTTRDMVIKVFDTLDTNTGINPVPATSSILRCYPSPTSGDFTIDMTGYSNGEKQISIYDQLGQIVYQTQTSQDKLQVGHKLSSGLYTVVVIQDAQRAYARIVVE